MFIDKLNLTFIPNFDANAEINANIELGITTPIPDL